MLIVFDVDGTLLGGEKYDWMAFEAALRAELGFVHTPGFFTSLGDVTAETVVAAVAKACGRELTDSVRVSVHDLYLAGLRSAHESDAQAFSARSGVKALLGHLRSAPEVSLAIATGDWRSTITFKLECAGIDVSGIPMATASDAVSRADIIRCAVLRADSDLSQTIYVGDGRWDLHACRELGIPLIATGARVQALVDAGAIYVCEELSVSAFSSALQRAIRPNQ